MEGIEEIWTQEGVQCGAGSISFSERRATNVSGDTEFRVPFDDYSNYTAFEELSQLTFLPG